MPKPSALLRDQRSGMVGPSESQTRRMVEALLNGATRKAARIAAGIPATSFGEWCAKGKDPTHEPYAGFRAAVLDAEAEVEENMCTVIIEAAPDDWKAAAWWLGVRRPKSFGKRAPMPNVVRADGGLDDPQKQAEMLESIRAALSTRPKQ